MSTILGYRNLCDFHTHTTYSLHGMSSPSEIVDAAIKEELEFIAITDHYYPYDPSINPYEYKNQKARLDCIKSYFRPLKDTIKVVSGWEYNLFASDDYDTYDMFDSFANNAHSYYRFNLIGYHDWFAPEKVSLPNIYIELSSRIHRGCYNCISHFEQLLEVLYNNGNDNAKLGQFIGMILREVLSSNMIMEVNESSIKRNRDFAEMWIRRAKNIKVPIIVNTDSHIKYSVGKVDTSNELLTSVEYPKDLIINLDRDKIISLIWK